MRILHYSLGFPPYRSGGLTKFCLDLMIEQKNEGDEVALLWPGQMGFIDKKIKNTSLLPFKVNLSKFLIPSSKEIGKGFINSKLIIFCLDAKYSLLFFIFIFLSIKPI